MISDAIVDALCDECGNSTQEIELHYVYASYSGKNGHYDDSNVEEELKEMGWEVVGEKHFCPSCK